MKFEDHKKLVRIGQAAWAVSPVIIFALNKAFEQNLIGDEDAIGYFGAALLAGLVCIIVPGENANLRRYKNFLAVAAKLFIEHEMTKESEIGRAHV